MKHPLHFQGHDMDADKVLSVDPVTTHSVSCSWEFGFTVRFPGNQTTILVPVPNQFAHSGGATREQYKAAANRVRENFLDALHKK